MATKLASTSEQFLSGAAGGLDSDVLKYTGGASSGDVIRMCKVQKGTRIEDLQIITDASNAGATLKAGWAYVDASASNDDEFLGATSIATASRLRATATEVPTVLTGDAYLILTVGGASVSAGTNIHVIPQAKFLGTP